MSDITTILSKNEEYKQLINSLLQRIKQTRMQTAIGVNSQLIKLYWSIGRDIVKMQENNTYGDAFIYQLSEDLQREFPDVKGFSYRNLHYMKNMYLTFNQLDANLPQPVAESSEGNLPQPVAESALDYVALVPWGHIRYSTITILISARRFTVL